jgi:hypothetical protein
MERIQGGAYIPGPKKTKGALKAAIKANPDAVELYATSNMGPQFADVASKLKVGDEFLVVGPDPYRKRDWYATVKMTANGLVVS